MNEDYIRGLRRAQQIARMAYKGSVVADKIEVEITAIALRSEQQFDRVLIKPKKRSILNWFKALIYKADLSL